MTRINLLDPSVLTDKHLMAEYHELPRIFTEVRKAIDKGLTPDDIDIPESYVLGNGHMKFFYDKCHWLQDRLYILYLELKRRGFNIEHDKYIAIYCNVPLGEWYGFYQPTPAEIYLNMARLCKRSKIDTVVNELNGED